MKHLFDLSHIELTHKPNPAPLRPRALLIDFVDGQRHLALTPEAATYRANILAAAHLFHPSFKEALLLLDSVRPDVLDWESATTQDCFSATVLFTDLNYHFRHKNIIRLAWLFTLFIEDCQSISNLLNQRAETEAQ